MAEITLESLIEEQKKRIPNLKFVPDPPGCLGFAYYCYDKSDEYQKWLATTSRFIGIHFPNDKDVSEFEIISKQEITPGQQQRLLAILEAFAYLPTIVPQKNEKKTGKGVNITANINNTNSQEQSQEQSLAISLFIEAIKDDLTGRQIKELKDVVNRYSNDEDKKRNGIIAKLKSFGSDVAANIVANIITNPTIWSGLSTI